ncbi:unnamed protein product [Dibothriocephalus latus]|uniref:Anamorsin N-terminal domain-containing protein n=1 Tax=Dibothriocephalus latus TaxID=60516 RepID=A0A3P7M7R8_DIBLA|nr:unnamed protein product [Dibothriocephalus latus]
MDAEVLKLIRPTDRVLIVWSSTNSQTETSMKNMLESLKTVVSDESAIQLENLEVYLQRPVSTNGESSLKPTIILTGWPEAFKHGQHNFEVYSRLVALFPVSGRIISRESAGADLASTVESLRKAAVLAGFVDIKFVCLSVSLKLTSSFNLKLFSHLKTLVDRFYLEMPSCFPTSLYKLITLLK